MYKFTDFPIEKKGESKSIKETSKVKVPRVETFLFYIDKMIDQCFAIPSDRIEIRNLSLKLPCSNGETFLISEENIGSGEIVIKNTVTGNCLIPFLIKNLIMKYEDGGFVPGCSLFVDPKTVSYHSENRRDQDCEKCSDYLEEQEPIDLFESKSYPELKHIKNVHYARETIIESDGEIPTPPEWDPKTFKKVEKVTLAEHLAKQFEVAKCQYSEKKEKAHLYCKSDDHAIELLAKIQESLIQLKRDKIVNDSVTAKRGQITKDNKKYFVVEISNLSSLEAININIKREPETVRLVT